MKMNQESPGIPFLSLRCSLNEFLIKKMILQLGLFIPSFPPYCAKKQKSQKPSKHTTNTRDSSHLLIASLKCSSIHTRPYAATGVLLLGSSSIIIPLGVPQWVRQQVFEK